MQDNKRSSSESPSPPIGDADVAAPSLLTPIATLGAATSIMLASPLHRHIFLTELDWLVVPAITSGQIRVFHHDGVPVAFATWAYLNADVAERFKAGMGRLKPQEWHCGEDIWLVELCAPYGGVKELLTDLAENTFAGKVVNTMRPAPDGSGPQVSTLKELAENA